MDGLKKNIVKAYKCAFYAMLAFSALYAFVMLPIYERVASDVAFSRTQMVDIVDFFLKVVEIIIMCIGYAMAIYVTYRNGKNSAYGVFLYYGGAVALKYVFSQMVLWISEGGIPGFNNGFFTESLWRIILPLCLELIQLLIFYLFMSHSLKKRMGNVNIPRLDDRYVYPIEKLTDSKNPVCRCAFISALTVFISRFLLITVDEIYLTLETRGLQTFSEWMTFILRYLSCFVLGVMAYFVTLFVLILLFDMYKKQAVFENDGTNNENAEENK